jgi:hypothetical protein
MAPDQPVQGIDIIDRSKTLMNETKLLESAVSEYRGIVKRTSGKRLTRLDTHRLARDLSSAHDWTDQGAHTIVSLANDYGAFMLRNALALAIALNKEDGDRRF